MKASIIIDNLHIEGVPLLPPETDAPLVVHPDTPLSFPISGQLLELITWRDPEVLKSLSSIQKFQLSLHAALYIAAKSSGPFAPENLFGLSVSEAAYHEAIITRGVNNLKR